MTTDKQAVKREDFSRITLRHNIEKILRDHRDAHPHTLADKLMAAYPVASLTQPKGVVEWVRARIDESAREMIEQRKAEYGSAFTREQQVAIEQMHRHQLIGANLMAEALTQPKADEDDCDHYKLVSGGNGPWTCIECGAVDPPRPKYERKADEDVVREAAFLCARLREFESVCDNPECNREYGGHVSPSLARLEMLLAAMSKGEK